MNRELKEKCESFINEFKKFSSDTKSYNKGIDDVENQNIPFKLPLDYKFILSKYNGFSLMGTEVLGVDKDSELSILQITFREQNEVELTMPKHIIPFSPDGRGNHYCFDLSRFNDSTEICPIVFWQYGYSNELEEIEIVNDSFIDWCNEVIIEWTLEDYDYNGNDIE